MTDLGRIYQAFDTDPGHIVSFLRRLAAAYGLVEPLRVLDVGCGPGRLLPPLAALGWEVTGMEPEPSFLARARALAEGLPGASAEPGGFGDVAYDAAFHLAVGVNSSFAHLLTPARRLDALHRLSRALRPGGVLFLDLPNFAWILKHYHAPTGAEATLEGRTVRMRRTHVIDYHAATFTTHDDYEMEGGEAARMTHVYGMTSIPEMEHHLAAAGFADVRTYRGYASTAPERLDGPRMMIAACRP